MAEAQPVGIREALRRVVVGFRGAAAAWVVALALVAVTTGSGRVPLILGAAVVAVGWAVITVLMAQGRPAALRTVLFLVLDTAVAGAIVVASSRAKALPPIAGAYPFSAVLLATYVRGYVGGLTAAAALSVVAIVQYRLEG